MGVCVRVADDQAYCRRVALEVVGARSSSPVRDVFAKLAITSRTRLARLELGERARGRAHAGFRIAAPKRPPGARQEN